MKSQAGGHDKCNKNIENNLGGGDETSSHQDFSKLLLQTRKGRITWKEENGLEQKSKESTCVCLCEVSLLYLPAFRHIV